MKGLSAEYDFKKIVKVAKKEFACNGTVVEHPEYGEVVQLQGDQREKICQMLVRNIPKLYPEGEACVLNLLTYFWLR